MFETRGRQSREVYIEGSLYLAKKPIKFNKSMAILLPKDWIEAVGMGRPIKYFLLDVRDTFIQVKPYFDELPAGQGGEGND